MGEDEPAVLTHTHTHTLPWVQTSAFEDWKDSKSKTLRHRRSSALAPLQVCAERGREGAHARHMAPCLTLYARTCEQNPSWLALELPLATLCGAGCDPSRAISIDVYAGKRCGAREVLEGVIYMLTTKPLTTHPHIQVTCFTVGRLHHILDRGTITPTA